MVHSWRHSEDLISSLSLRMWAAPPYASISSREEISDGIPTMKAVILAGGSGARISEESGTKPEPMVDIGGRAALWHILKISSE